ncbi:MAG: FAD:protein FMN transferase [Acidobacteria bacterium]|nr:MAG: FAD:protein FMN transferase [Acidobacteriota bacterium]
MRGSVTAVRRQDTYKDQVKATALRKSIPICTFLVLLLPACSFFSPDPVSSSFETMGTRATLTLAGKESSKLSGAADKTKQLMQDLNAELSVYRPDSAVSRLNAVAGVRPLEVPEHTRRLLELSKVYGELTSGAFDVTVGPVVDLWRPVKGQTTSLPTDDALNEALARVDFRQIQVMDRSAFLAGHGMRVDLGGIGKGYAVDLAWRECRNVRVLNFMFDLGGNLRVSGEAESGLAWSIAIRNPFERSATLAKMEMPDEWAVATSGQYERFIEIEGRRYGHIVDPRTGYPAAGLAAVTILAPNATMADALSTGLFVLGPKRSIPILKKTGAEAVFIPDKQPAELWVTPGIRSKLTVLIPAKVQVLPGW